MRPRLIAATAAVAAVSAAAVGVAVSPEASAHGRTPQQPLEPKSQFTMVVKQADGTVAAPTHGADIPNIDSVKSTIRAYYGAYKGADPTGQAPGQIYLPNLTDSAYVDNVHRVEASILKSLPAHHKAHQAVVFDVDATLLLDYAFEDATNFNYDSAVNKVWVEDKAFPAVPGMPDLLATIKSRGYDLYGITGRPYSQEDATVANLAEQGYAVDGTALFDNDNLYTKWNTAGGEPTKPAYIGDCTLSATCNTVEYKANTRKHIETDLGDKVVMNVGDQWSDLEGGYAAAHTKIPNPTYFLAAADIAGAPSSDKTMVPPTHYTMAPDGTSGTKVRSGDDIPNLDPLRKMIRAFYSAPTGIADKTSSAYISEVTSLTSSWTHEAVRSCQAGASAVATASARLAAADHAVAVASARLDAAHGSKARAAASHDLAAARRAASRIHVPAAPAAVFDSDDTTLWNYDMEDGLMKFAYNPTVAAGVIAAHGMPAVPGMIDLVKSLDAAGCTVFGLTGRPHTQQADTIANLTEDGYVDSAGQPLFTDAQFYTKWNSGEQPPAYVDCGTDGTCSTIDYKSSTRAHIEDSGFDVVANFGDQFSDLIGGHADHTYKIPNPTYYLP